MVKTYIPAPDLFHPPGGCIDLGKIWTDPKDPTSCINRSRPREFPPDMQPQLDSKTQWSNFQKHDTSGMVGVWAKFLQCIGIDAEFAISGDFRNVQDCHFDVLKTESIEPTPPYVEESMQAPEVEKAIASKSYRTRVYMVTGVQIAVGAKVGTRISRDARSKMVLGIDGTPAGAPAKAGPKTAFSSEKIEKLSLRTRPISFLRIGCVRYVIERVSRSTECTTKALRIVFPPILKSCAVLGTHTWKSPYQWNQDKQIWK